MDVLITFLVIKNGGIELNPLGYNYFTIISGFLVMIPLLIVNIFSKDIVILSIIFTSAIIISFMLLTVINQGIILL